MLLVAMMRFQPSGLLGSDSILVRSFTKGLARLKTGS
jgi:hypothetical protein